MSFTTVTVAGTYEIAPGVPASGNVQFQLNSDITDGTSTIAAAIPITAVLDSTGSFSVQMFANDDTTTTPTGTLWQVTENLYLPNVVSRGYLIALTKAHTSVNIASIAPSIPQIPAFNYITQTAADARYQPIGGGGGGGATLVPTAIKTANYTAAIDDLARMSAAAASRVVTLPNGPADLAQVGVEVVALSGTNTVTVNCAGSDVFLTAGGGTSLVLRAAGDTLILQYSASGSTWNILSLSPFTASDIGALAVAKNLLDVNDPGQARYNLHIATLNAQAASNVNIALTGQPIIDTTYQSVVGDTVFCFAQTNGTQNGPWIVTASGPWTRPTDFPSGGTTKGRICLINGGNQYQGHFFILATTSLLTIDTDSLSWFDDDTTLALIASSGELSDALGLLNLSQLPAGVPFFVYYLSGNYLFPGFGGAPQSARPTSRVDVPMVVLNAPALPSWAIDGDLGGLLQ